MADFRDVVSALPGARLIKAISESLWLNKKVIDRDKSRSLSWLFNCHHSQVRNIKEAAACKLIGAKKGAIFSLIYVFKSFCIFFIILHSA